jgi:predicted enzyme related to lactoylglutathione lyase
VDDLNSATKKAKELGATVLEAPIEGPAGTYTPIQEPGGAVFALFQPRA